MSGVVAMCCLWVPFARLSCVQLVTLRQDYSVTYHDTQLKTVGCERGGCIISILMQENMMCNLGTCSVKNCSVCTCVVQSGYTQCDVCVCA